MTPRLILGAFAFCILTARGALGQSDRSQHAQHVESPKAAPTQSGQSAFAAISEIVRLLEADPNTNWARVDIEALRQHLADMDDVTLRSRVATTAVPGGARFMVSGDGRIASAIGRIVTAHAHVLDALPDLRADAASTPSGTELTVTAERLDDVATVARIRGLGFAGLLVTGEHHASHHLALARGEGEAAHRHQ